MSSQKQDPPHSSPKLDVAAGDLEKNPHTQVDAPTDDPSNNHVVPVSLSDLFRYSTKFELFLDFIGLICAAAAGASQPLMTILFGNLTQSFVSFAAALRANDAEGLEAAKTHFRHVAAKDALWLTLMGIGIYAVTHAFMFIWTYTGEVNSKRIREHYLRAVLRQDIAFFDNLGPGEVTTRIQTDTHLVQQGISEKVPWKTMGSVEAKWKQLSLSEIAAGANLAEEVISTIRTSQAFGAQRTLAAVYDTFAIKVTGLENKIAIGRGLGVGILFFVLYS
ncbi:GTPase-activating protein, partial [Tulasnella sp. 417]